MPRVKLKAAGEWVSDEAVFQCLACQTPFGLFNRKRPRRGGADGGGGANPPHPPPIQPMPEIPPPPGGNRGPNKRPLHDCRAQGTSIGSPTRISAQPCGSERVFYGLYLGEGLYIHWHEAVRGGEDVGCIGLVGSFVWRQKVGLLARFLNQ